MWHLSTWAYWALPEVTANDTARRFFELDRNNAPPIRWRGKSYANIGWALPDFYKAHPLAGDRFVADFLGVDRITVQKHRTRVGIPPASQRCPVNPYARKEES